MSQFVATLIARPPDAAGLASALAACTAAVSGAELIELAPDEAVDVVFTADDADLATVRADLRQHVAHQRVDVVVQPTEGRRKKLLIADMDSTIIGQECLDELADFAGLKTEVAAITERAMAGEIEFEPALRQRVRLLAGLPANTVDKVIAERVRLNPGARTLVWTMRAAGARTILVSGGFTAFTEKVAAMAGFDESQANRLIVENGKLTGEVAVPILGRVAKLAALEDSIIRFGLSAEETMAVGDGANDIGMIARAGLGVAFRAKPKTAAAADASIVHGDLTALLFAQGFRRADFLE